MMKHCFKSQAAWEIYESHNSSDLVDWVAPVCEYPKWFTVETDETGSVTVVSLDGKSRLNHTRYTIPFTKREYEYYINSVEVSDARELVGLDISKEGVIAWVSDDPEALEYTTNKYIQHQIKKKEKELTNELHGLKIRERDIYKELNDLGSSITPSNMVINIED